MVEESVDAVGEEFGDKRRGTFEIDRVVGGGGCGRHGAIGLREERKLERRTMIGSRVVCGCVQTVSDGFLADTDAHRRAALECGRQRC